MSSASLSQRYTARPTLEALARSLFEFCAADQIFIYRVSDPDGALMPFLALGSLSLQEKQAFWTSQIEQADPFAAGLLEQPELPLILSPEQSPASGSQALTSGSAALTNGSQALTGGSAALFDNLRTQTWLVYPLAEQDDLLGLALLGWMRAGYRQPAEQAQPAAALARAMALEIENERLRETAHHQRQQALISQEITRSILRWDELAQILSFIAGEVMGATSALGCCIGLLDEHGKAQIAAQVGEPCPALPDAAPPGPAAPGAVRVVPFESADGEPALLLTLPLFSGERAIGFLQLYQVEAYYQPKDALTAGAFAGQAAVAVELAGLYQRLQQSAVAEERARLARDLHDSISQSLYAMTLYTRAARRRLGEENLPAVEQYLAELEATSRGVLGEMRLLIYELRPQALEQYGLKGLLEQRLQAVEARSGLAVQLEIDLPQPLPGAVEEHLYHIVQEALNNTIKHAQASRVQVALTQAEHVTRLTIQDDGQGFDPAGEPGGGQGLKNIQERAAALHGRLTIDTHPGAGVTLSLEVPDGKDTHPDR